ncbi:hypothetical protein HKD37_13G038266 [Glycine soja]
MKLSSIPLNSKYYAAPDFINRSIVLFIVGRGFRVSTEGLVDEVDDNDVVRVGGCGGGCSGGEGVRGSEGSADDDEIKFDGINGRVGEDNNDEVAAYTHHTHPRSAELLFTVNQHSPYLPLEVPVLVLCQFLTLFNTTIDDNDLALAFKTDVATIQTLKKGFAAYKA